jgi:hypothetical protein
MELEVRGAIQLAALSMRLRAGGESGKGLRRELFAAIQRGTKVVKADVQDSWSQNAPHRGGLSQRPLRLSTRTRAGGKNVGVRIVSASRDGYSLGSIDQGRVKHPVFGNRKAWAVTNIQPGIITDPQEKAAPAVRAEIVRAIEGIARKVEG